MFTNSLFRIAYLALGLIFPPISFWTLRWASYKNSIWRIDGRSSCDEAIVMIFIVDFN